jgi:pimeloyl-ACP methyl ester carboxylesterase
LEAYAKDVEDMAYACAVNEAHLVSWCAGADILAEVVHRRRLSVRSATLITPILPDEPASGLALWPFHQMFNRMVGSLLVANDMEGEQILRRIQRVLSLSADDDPIELLVQRLTRMNFATLDRARQALRVMEVLGEGLNIANRRLQFEELFSRVPTHLVCFQDDQIAGCPSNLDRKRSATLSFDIQRSGGHSAIFKLPDVVCASIARFYQSHGFLHLDTPA